ncbi:MAG: BolA/IbaG family iron-sulfur metabolism protein, partial [Haemophilus parainfluenzae]|nr:BolA/IbaG family iron-sulfur metabolism protein [Haemophilus parainfluenzae]
KVQRHQKLYQLFADDLKNGIHALALHLYTKSEWESLGEAFPKSPNCLGVGQ